MGNEDRIDEAVEAGQLAFWTEVAKAFPECKPHDLDDTLTRQLFAQMKHAVTEWVQVNSPERRPWVLEFGRGYAVPYEIDEMVARGILADESRRQWRRPRFSHRGEGVLIVLCVEHPDPDRRLAGQSCRFGVYIQRGDAGGCPDNPDEYIYDGDDLGTAIAALNAAIAARDPLARHVAGIYGDLKLAVNIAAIVEGEIVAGSSDEEIADTLSTESGLNGDQMAELIRLGRASILG